MAVQHERHAALVPLGTGVTVHHHAGSGVFEILLLVDSEIQAPAGAQTAAMRPIRAEVLIVFMLSPFRGPFLFSMGAAHKGKIFSTILPVGYEK